MNPHKKKALRKKRFFLQVFYLLQNLNVCCSGTLFALLDVKGYALIFVQYLEAVTLNSAVMNKYIATFIIGDEAETLAFIEPFNYACIQCGNPPFFVFLKLDRPHCLKNSED